MAEQNLENFGYEVLTEAEAASARQMIEKIIANVESVIIGKHEKVELAVLCLLAGGHILLDDVPGVGKTSLVTALAKTIDCDYSRIQFTPDVMPSDVSGFSIYNQKSGEFEFRPGPAMSNLVLADEINRASAKTQSAMLEIMEERQVTVDSNTYKLASPFMVMATQNPIESLGTYKLPEAQIDRFMIRISLGYPDFENELDIVLFGEQNKRDISYVTNTEEVNALIAAAKRVYISRQIAAYIVQIVTQTRTHPDIKLGCSPRGSIALYALSRAFALSRGRYYVTPDDVKYLAPYVLAHRVILTHDAKTSQRKPEEIIDEILRSIIVPI